MQKWLFAKQMLSDILIIQKRGNEVDIGKLKEVFRCYVEKYDMNELFQI